MIAALLPLNVQPYRPLPTKTRTAILGLTFHNSRFERDVVIDTRKPRTPP
jgi:hypothetical protein